MKIFAHRGLCALYPENTIKAFTEAMKYNVDGMETDVQLSKDGELMIFHDELLERTTKEKGFLKDYTKEELKKMNASYGHEGFYEIPTLDELLDAIEEAGLKDTLTLNLELKTSIFEYEGIEEKVAECLKKHGFHDTIIISSFNHYTLLRYKKIDPEMRTAVLTGDRIVDAIKYTHSLGCSCYHPFFSTVSPSQVMEAHNLGIEINVWTCDWPEYKPMLEGIGIDTMMTNACHIFTEKR